MSRPTQAELDEAMAYEENWNGGVVVDHGNVLYREVLALRNELEYERQFRHGLQGLANALKALGTQLTAADEVLP